MVRPHVVGLLEPGADRRPRAACRVPHALCRRRGRFTRKPDGRLHAVGDTLSTRDMARRCGASPRRAPTISTAARSRRAITADMAAQWRPARRGRSRGQQGRGDAAALGHLPRPEIATNPPPGGGMMLIEMLNILEHFDLRALGHNSPAYIAIVAEAMKIGAVDRDQQPRRSALRRRAGRAADVEAATPPRWPSASSAARRRTCRGSPARRAADTTQVCVVDARRHVRLAHPYARHAVRRRHRGLGFMYNGAMGAFDPRPGRAGSLAPGKARVVVDGAEHRVQRRQAVLRGRRAGRHLHHARASCRRFSTWSISA